MLSIHPRKALQVATAKRLHKMVSKMDTNKNKQKREYLMLFKKCYVLLKIINIYF